MKKLLLTALIAVCFAVTLGGDAFAKAGKSSSMGSRGSRTDDRPIERSLTPPPAAKAAPVAPVQQQPLGAPQAQSPMMQPQPAMAAASMQKPGFFQRNPFLTGVMGGLVGVGIGSMLFGGSDAMAAANEAAPMASMFGTLLQIALIGGIGWLLFRMFRRKTAAVPADGAAYAGGGYGQPAGYQPAGGQGSMMQAPRVEKEFDADHGDFDAFTAILVGVQKAWSEGDMMALRKLATPEIVGWMAEDLASDQSAGMRNVVEDVTLLKGEVTESWRENGREYLTARITFSCRDYTVRLQDGQVVDGDAKVMQTNTELWTFLRSADGGNWLLTAIEQVSE